MKNIKIYFLISTFFFFSLLSQAQLTGIKTIKTSGGDYVSFNAAFTALNNSGVGTGGVIFNVDANFTSTEVLPTLNVKSTALGTATNTIIFQKSGSGSNPKITQSNSQSGNSDAVIKIQGTGSQYITFDGIDVTGATDASTEYGYNLQNASATVGVSNITIKNCVVTLNNNNSSTNNVIGLFVNDATTPTQASGACSNNTFNNITIKNAKQGIYINGNSSFPELNVTISNCTVGDPATNNDITATSTASPVNGQGVLGVIALNVQGFSAFNNSLQNITSTNGSVQGMRINTIGTGNKFYNNTISSINNAGSTGNVFGLRIEANPSSSIDVYNNVLYGIQTSNTSGQISFISFNNATSSSGTINAYFNSIRMSVTTDGATAYGFNVGNVTLAGTYLLNNNIVGNYSTASATGGKKYCINNTGSGTLTSNNNVFYYDPSQSRNLTGSSGGDRLTLANWQSVASRDANSISSDPTFTSATNLVPKAYYTGIAIAGISTDILGTSRGASPYIGAYESATTPTGLIKTIKTSGGDFATFTAAVNYYNTLFLPVGGVTFNVDAGFVSTEVVPTLTGFTSTPGTASKPTMFQKSGSGGNPKLTQTSGQSGNSDAVIKIQGVGAQYITFNGIDIQGAADASTEYGYFIQNFSATVGISNLTVKNCTITLNNNNSSTNNVIGILVNDATTPTQASGASSYNTFDNVTIKNVKQGIYLSGNATYRQLGVTISNCTIGDPSTANDVTSTSAATPINGIGIFGIQATNVEGFNAYNNTIQNVTATIASVQGLRINNWGTGNKVYNNIIFNINYTASTGNSYGIRIESNPSATIDVYNNVVYGMQTSVAGASGNANFIALNNATSSSGNVNAYFNTIRMGVTNDAAAAFGFNVGNTTLAGSYLLNNNIVGNYSTASVSGGKKYCISNSGSGTLTSNYNVFYYDASQANNLTGASGGDRITLANWQSVSSRDANSIGSDPTFTSTTNLIPKAYYTGINISGITSDIVGTTRGGTPYIGAYESTTTPTGLVKTIKISGGDFSSFTAAVNYYNTLFLPVGGITFNVDANYTSIEVVPTLSGLNVTPGTSSKPIVFQKSGSGSNPKITQTTNQTGTTDAVIRIQGVGAQFVTFDGIDVEGGDASTEFGYILQNASATVGASNITIKNCSITLSNNNSSTNNVIGLFVNDATTPTQSSGASSNNIFSNIVIKNVKQGIYLNGNGSYPQIGVTISGCTVGDPATSNDITSTSSAIPANGQGIFGIFASNVQDVLIYNNTVQNVTSNAGSCFGLRTGNFGSGNKVYNNLVSTINNTFSSGNVFGLRIESLASSTIDVYNNVVYGLSTSVPSASGNIGFIALNTLSSSSSGGVNAYFNSIRMGITETAGGFGFNIGWGVISLNNNIIGNFSTASASGGKKYCINNSGSGTLNSNYNILYYDASQSRNLTGNSGGDRVTLANWQAVSSRDANSYSLNPNFTSATNLIPASTYYAGTSIGGITTDIMGTTRFSIPSIGAYESPTGIVTANPTFGTFSAITKNFGDVAFTLTAPTSTSAGAFSYTSSNTAVATVSGSTVTIVSAGTSTITATQAANGNFLSGTTTTILTVNKIASTLSVTNSPVGYNGSPRTATVTGLGGGTVSNIRYDGSATAPTNAGIYAITADIAATTNYNAGTGLSAGSFVINPATTTLSVTNSPVTYTGSAQSATVSGLGGGTVSNVRYDGSLTVPTNAGTYAVTADIAASANYNAGTGLSAGNFTINKATLSSLSITNTPAGYTGSPVAAVVIGTGGGTVSNVLYAGSAIVPTNVGTYTVTANIAASTNYNAGTAMSAGTFTIAAIVPDAPINVTSDEGDASTIITFDPPAFNGGAAITGYVARAYIGATLVATQSATSSPYTFTGLTNGSSYTFTVAAINSAGTGSYSVATSPAIIPTSTTIWDGIAWSAGVPSATSIVIINGNYSTAVPFICKNLQVNAGKVVTSTSTITLKGTPLIINGTITGTGTLILNSTSAQAISGTGTVGNITVNTSNGVTVSSGSNKLNITGVLTLQSGTFTTNGNVVLKSTSFTNSATLAPVGASSNTGTISGTVHVERFIPKGYRAWRDMAPGVFNAGSIYNNWQETGSYANNGYGLFITGTTTSTSSHAVDATTGLDQTINSVKSAYTFTNGTWNAVANTKTTNLNPFLGYRLLVRGDRSFNLYTTPISTVGTTGWLLMNAATSLRAKGNLITGNVVYSTSGITNAVAGATYNSTSFGLNSSSTTGFSSVANPYVAPIDWKNIWDNNRAVNLTANYYYLDPTIGSTGAYVSYNAVTDATSNGAIGSRRYIQAGQAFFVENNNSTAPSLTITEADKAIGSTKTSVFGNANRSRLTISLMKSTGSELKQMDGATVVFNPAFSNDLGREDAKKMTNSGENLAINHEGQSLSIEGRKPATAAESLPLSLSQLATSEYQLTIDAAAYQSDNLQLYLVDAFNKGETLLTSGINNISFTVEANNPATYANRFSVVFKAANKAATTATPIVSSTLSVYPNPLVGKTITVRLGSEAVAGKYVVNVYNSLGQQVHSGFYNYAGSVLNCKLPQALAKGGYQLMVLQEGKVVGESKIIVE